MGYRIHDILMLMGAGELIIAHEIQLIIVISLDFHLIKI
jgi:hypothetical protein